MNAAEVTDRTALSDADTQTAPVLDASLAYAVSRIEDNSDVFVCGGDEGRPMATVRELVRARRRGLTLWTRSPVAALKPLAEARVADQIHAASSEGQRSEMGSEAVLASRLRAAAAGHPFALLPMETTPSLAEPEALRVRCPFTGAEPMAVPALRPDVALLHAVAADSEGNVRLSPGAGGEYGLDLLAAAAAETVLVTVEQIVSAEALASSPQWPLLVASAVSAVVEAPFGAYPTALPKHYRADSDPPSSLGTKVAGDWFDHLDTVGPYRLLQLASHTDRGSSDAAPMESTGGIADLVRKGPR